MATSVTGSVGQAGVGTLFNNPVSIGVSSPSGQYPDAKIEFLDIGSGASGKAYWRNSSGSTQTFTMNICDSAGSILVPVFTGSIAANGFSNTLGLSQTFTNTNKSLVGKALYLKITGDHPDKINLYRASQVKITLGSYSYSIKSAVSPSGGGSVTLGSTTATYNQKTQIKASASTGYTFANWTKTSGTISNTTATTSTFTMGTASATVTANFTHNTYSLSKASSPSAGGTVTLGATSGYYNTKVKLTASAATGYTFSSWSKSSGTLSSTTANPATFTFSTSNATVTGNFTANTYALTSDVSPSSSGSVTLGNSSPTYNQKVQIKATASTGYTFSSWSCDYGSIDSTTSATTTFTMPNRAAEVTAAFTANTYTVSSAVSPSGGGSVSLGSASGTYNQKVQIIATASTGYEFSSWTASGGSIQSSSSSTTTFTLPNANSTVTASFTHVTHTVSTAVTPADSGTVTLSSNTGYYNDTITVTATPAYGYEFIGWSASDGTFADASSASTTFTIPNSNPTITASFNLAGPVVTVSPYPSDSGAVTGDGVYTDGDVIGISAVPMEGYIFREWTSTGGTFGDATSPKTTFTVPATDADITAIFDQIAYVHAGDISWTTSNGSLSITCDMINESNVTQSQTVVPATVKIRLYPKS